MNSLQLIEAPNHQLCEESQDLKVKFAWATPTSEGVYTTLQPWVKCKDFLHDHLWAIEHKTEMGIYGYQSSYQHDGKDLDASALLLAVDHPGVSTLVYRDAVERTFGELEKIGPFTKPIKAITVKGNNERTIFEVDDLWKRTVWAPALLTLALRGSIMALGGGEKGVEYYEAFSKLGMKDCRMWKDIFKFGLVSVMENFDKLSEMGIPPKDINSSTLHHRTGIHTVSAAVLHGTEHHYLEPFKELYEKSSRTKDKKGRTGSGASAS